MALEAAPEWRLCCPPRLAAPPDPPTSPWAALHAVDWPGDVRMVLSPRALIREDAEPEPARLSHKPTERPPQLDSRRPAGCPKAAFPRALATEGFSTFGGSAGSDRIASRFSCSVAATKTTAATTTTMTTTTTTIIASTLLLLLLLLLPLLLLLLLPLLLQVPPQLLRLLLHSYYVNDGYYYRHYYLNVILCTTTASTSTSTGTSFTENEVIRVCFLCVFCFFRIRWLF